MEASASEMAEMQRRGSFMPRVIAGGSGAARIFVGRDATTMAAIDPFRECLHQLRVLGGGLEKHLVGEIKPAGQLACEIHHQEGKELEVFVLQLDECAS